jgi:hypothetical protein
MCTRKTSHAAWLVLLNLLFLAQAVWAAPQVLYTDIVSGPTSGGENNKGVYLSIFGRGFGEAAGLGSTTRVYINNVEVDNYRYLGVSRGRSDIQQIAVQVGAIGNPTPGVALPLRVVVNGEASNTDHTFMAQPGDILFVDNVSGNDATAVKNDITHPWRYVQTADGQGGALSANVISPGDVIVMRDRGVPWSDIGYLNRFARFRYVTGTAPTGAKGSGPITIMGYPGENAHIRPQPNTYGGIHGIGEAYPQFSDWVNISNLRIEGGDRTVKDGPINLQVKSDNWRIVNNELYDWWAEDGTQGSEARSGGIAGNGTQVAILGNHIHHIDGGTLNHCIYLDTGAVDVEIGYNHIHDCMGGNIVQTYDNLGTAALENIRVHHNLLHDGNRYGLNISGGTRSLQAWDNAVYNTDFAGVRLSVAYDTLTDITIAFNTLYNNQRANGGDGRAPIVNSWNYDVGVGRVFNNIVYAGNYATSYFSPYGPAPNLQFARNLWYGLNKGAPSVDVSPIGGSDRNDPLFENQAASDFHLQLVSPAIDQATAALPFIVTDDYDMVARPQGQAPDAGAYEYASAVVTPPPTVNLSASPTSIAYGASSILNWSSANADSCSASGSWSGPRTLSGSESTGALTVTATYTLTCTGAGGSTSQSVTVTVAPPPVPTVTLSANPASIAYGASSTLAWTSIDATSCSASGAWSGVKALSGSESTGTLTGSASYTLTCTGAGGSASRSVTVTVASPPPPTVTLSANPATVTRGGSSTLSWTTTNAESCTASGAWSGSKPTSGSESTGPLGASATYTLTCAGAGGSASRSVTVTVKKGKPKLSIVASPSVVSPGGRVIVSWRSTDAIYCVAGNGWHGRKPVSGQEVVSGIQGRTEFAMACYNQDGSVHQSAWVRLAP